MSSHILLNSLIVLFLVTVASKLILGVFCVRAQKKYGVDVRPNFNGSYGIDRVHLKSLVENGGDSKYIPDLKKILLLSRIHGISFTLFAGSIVTIFLLALI